MRNSWRILHVVLMLGALCAIVAIVLSRPSIFFAANTISDSKFQDSNNDGTVDRIRWKFDENVTSCTYEAEDWQVMTAGTLNVSITGLTCAGNDRFLYIGVTADTGETSAATPPVLTYKNNDADNSVVLESGAATNKENVATTDNASPMVTAAQVLTAASSGITRNAIKLTYSEAVNVYTGGDGSTGAVSADTVTASSATLGAMTTARTLDGIGSWGADSGGDMTVSAATVNGLLLENSGTTLTIIMNSADAGYFAAGSTAPTTASFTPVADENDIKDAAGNTVNGSQSAVAMTVTTAWDVTAPTLATTYSCATDVSGKVKRAQVNFSESMLDAALTAGTFELDNDATNDGTGEETPASMSTSTQACDTLAADADANDEKISLDLTTGIAGTDSVYVHIPAIGGRDWAGNRIASVAGGGTETDKAAPLLTSTTPTHGQAGILRTSTVVLNFSEPMDINSTVWTLTGNATLQKTWSNGDATVTITPGGTMGAGTHTFSITTAPDTSANAFGGAATGATLPFTFYVAGGGTSAASAAAAARPITYGIALASPTATDTLTPGAPVSISWTTSGTGTISAVTLTYSLDGGATFLPIAENISATMPYTWNVPADLVGPVVLRVQGTDLLMTLATAQSDPLTVASSSTTPITSENVTTTEVPVDPADPAAAADPTPPATPATVLTGTSYLRARDNNTIYLFDGVTRRPFLDPQIFHTYAATFADVLVVEPAVLTAIPLGTPVPPAPGKVLIKTPSSPRVYAVEAAPDGGVVLRWITSEVVAITLFGPEWAQYVIDLPESLLTQWVMGEIIDQSQDISPDLGEMKMRRSL